MVDYRENAKWTVYIHIVPKELSGYEYDKYYVGITSMKPQYRWGKEGNGYNIGKTHYFFNAIQKYGWDNIQHEIFASNLTENEAKSIESRLILELQSFGKYGYNLTKGGDGTVGKEPTNVQYYYVFDLDGNFIDKVKTQNRIAEKYGLKWHRIHIAIKNHTQLNNYYFASENEIIKQDNGYTLKNFDSYNEISCIYQFDLLGNFINKYSSVQEASRKTGISADTISDHVNHRFKSTITKNFIWRKTCDVHIINNKYVIKDEDYKNRFVYQLDSDGKCVNLFPNTTIASRSTGISAKEIYYIMRKISNGEKTFTTAHKWLWCNQKDIAIDNDGNFYYPFTPSDKPYYNKKNEWQYKVVYQFDCDLHFINKYESVLEASTITGVERSKISRIASGKLIPQKNKKYIWRYKEDVQESEDNSGSFIMLR